MNNTDMSYIEQNTTETGSGTQSLGARILALRKAASMTQEQLAERLGVTFQAVSKWENDIACPDVLLLPALADTFGISIDELFGRAAPAARPAPTVMDGLPWSDDNGLYAVVCKGHTLLSHMQILRHSREIQKLKVEYRGEALNVTSDFSVEVHGNVAGNVDAKDGVACGSVGGNVTAGDGVACGGVGGNVTAGDSVTCGSVEGVKEELARLTARGFLTEDQRQMVSASKIAAFFATPLGSKLLDGTAYLREFKFSILDDGRHYDPDLEGEQVLLQGVVDCAIMEDDGITVLDFKTDYVTEENLDAVVARYRIQVETYADALRRIYGKPVKAAYLYFFRLGQFVKV